MTRRTLWKVNLSSASKFQCSCTRRNMHRVPLSGDKPSLCSQDAFQNSFSTQEHIKKRKSLCYQKSHVHWSVHGGARAVDFVQYLLGPQGASERVSILQHLTPPLSSDNGWSRSARVVTWNVVQTCLCNVPVQGYRDGQDDLLYSFSSLHSVRGCSLVTCLTADCSSAVTSLDGSLTSDNHTTLYWTN